MNFKPQLHHPQSQAAERRSWMGWMTGQTWEALCRCDPWPTPHRVARAYRELYGRPPQWAPRGRRAYTYSAAEILAVAALLQQRTAETEARKMRRALGLKEVQP